MLDESLSTRKFDGASSFNSDLSRWNVSNLVDASYMFFEASTFNQNLCPWRDRLPTAVILDEIFVGSSCNDTMEPSHNGESFCTQCVE